MLLRNTRLLLKMRRPIYQSQRCKIIVICRFLALVSFVNILSIGAVVSFTWSLTWEKISLSPCAKFLINLINKIELVWWFYSGSFSRSSPRAEIITCFLFPFDNSFTICLTLSMLQIFYGLYVMFIYNIRWLICKTLYLWPLMLWLDLGLWLLLDNWQKLWKSH